MKKSEKILAAATAVGAALFMYFTFFSSDAPTTDAAADSGSLATEQARFKDYQQTLKEGKHIQQEYERLTLKNVPEVRPNERPGATFGNELARILMQEFNQPSPAIQPYQLSPIPKIDDYYFIDIQVDLNGKISDMIRLLIQMEQRGLLIKEFTLEVRGPGLRGDATLSVKVARLVQHDKFSRQQLKARRSSSR